MKAKGRLFLVVVVVFAMVQVGMCAQAGAKTVVFGSWESWTDQGSPEQMLIAKFEKQYPDVKVEMRVIPYDGYVEKLRVMMAAGERLDLLHIDGSRYVELIVAGWMEPISDHLTQAELDLLTKSYVDSNSVNGKLYGLIGSEWADSLIVRPDFIKEAGWDLESIKTWDDFVKVAKALTKDTNGDGIIDRFGFGAEARSFIDFTIHSDEIFKGNGISPLEVNKEKSYKEVLELLSSLAPFMPPEIATASASEKRRMWGTGRLAMTVHGNWWANQMMNVNPDVVTAEKLTVMPFPQGPSSVKGKETYWNRQWVAYTAFKDSPNKEEAIELIKFLTLDKENALPLIGTPLPTLKAATIDDVVRYHPNGEELRSWFEAWCALAEYPSSITTVASHYEEWAKYLTAEYIKLIHGDQSVQKTYEAILRIYNTVGPEALIK